MSVHARFAGWVPGVDSFADCFLCSLLDRDIALLSPSVAHVENPESEIRLLADAESSAALARQIGKRDVAIGSVPFSILSFRLLSNVKSPCLALSPHISCRRIIPAVAAVPKRCSFWHVWPITALHPREARHRIRGSSAMPVFAGVEASLCLLTEMSVVAGRVRIPGDVVRRHATTV